MGLLLGESARFHPLWKGFIFCRLAKTFDSLNTMCWKKSRAESTFLLSAFLPLRLGASLNVPCLMPGWTHCRNFPVSTFPTPITAFPLQWHKPLQGPDSEALLFSPSSGKPSSNHLLHQLDRCSWMCYPLLSLGSSIVTPRTRRLDSSPRCPDRFAALEDVVLGTCRVSGSRAEAVWGFHRRNIQIVVQSLSQVWLFDPMDCSPPGFPVLHSSRVFSNSCPLSQWYHPTISSSVTHFSFCPQSFPASGSFLMSRLFASGG